jgi:hypothetical protein
MDRKHWQGYQIEPPWGFEISEEAFMFFGELIS